MLVHHLADEDSENNADHNINNNKGDIIQNGVSGDHKSIRRSEQVFKIIESDPVATPDPFTEIHLFKSND
ncbi:hypothetical protein D3C76_1171250 [compost metagenome]